MGLTDMMKQSNQSTNGAVIGLFQKNEDHKIAANKSASARHGEVAPNKSDGTVDVLSNSVWSTEGLLSSSRLFQRSSSTPPTDTDVVQSNQAASNGDVYGLGRFDLREADDENNQDEDVDELDRQDLVMPIGKHIQRAWSAPPAPDSFKNFFTKPKEKDAQRTQTRTFSKGGGLHQIAENSRSAWSEDAYSTARSFEKASVATVSPPGSPQQEESRPSSNSGINASNRGAPYPRAVFSHEKRASHPLMSLVDRVQEDFPRTPSPVLDCPDGPGGVFSAESLGHSLSGAMKHLRIENSGRNSTNQPTSRNDRGFVPIAFPTRSQDLRQPQRSQNQLGAFVSQYPIPAPPGFHAPMNHGVYDSPMVNPPRTPWALVDEVSGYSNNRFPVAPVDYGMMPHGHRGPFKNDFYHAKFNGGLYGQRQHEAPGRDYHGHGHPVYPIQPSYNVQEHHAYNGSQPSLYRSKAGPPRRNDFHVHPAHTYSSTSLLEEFKGATKTEKWDLRAIQGHLLEFARDQAGSRFIQQRLEKADDRAREDAFDEVFPEALLLMTDVFGNYVIQKFFDHGSQAQQQLLVGMMKKNMVNLALQVYGCRVIQKALEVTQVDEQLILIREMRGHVMKCVVDQNGNHVLQKCIEAASWKKCMEGGAQRHVLGEDIQFIIDAFVGQAAALSTHAYGCRVIQRVLEHCTPDQIRPIVNEIIFKCRELVKDQFGNYVVQHVVCHGEVEQRDIVMQAILPDVAKWSQHKYASNVVEACLDCANKEEISQLIELILDCDETGSSCALLPMMKHMYGNYVVQKLLDRADRSDRQRIVRIIQHNADYLKRFTYGKHVLSRLERESSIGRRETISGHRDTNGGRYY